MPHFIFSLINGSIASPEVPRTAIILAGIFYGWLVIFAVLLLFVDTLSLFLKFFSVRFPCGSTPLSLLALLSLVFSIIGVANAVRIPDVHRIELPVRGLPSEFDGYRIVHLSDLHISKLLQQRWITDVVEKTNQLKPDLILISGDLVDGKPENRRQDYPALGALRAKDGVFGVSGNHEYYSQYSRWAEIFHHLNIVMLHNTHRVIRRGVQGIIIAGVPDLISQNYGDVAADLNKALKGIPENMPVILLDHRPARFDDNREINAIIQLSGHTHGGHIIGLDRIVKLANKGYVSGFYRKGRSTLYVNNGAGLWPGFPLRLGRSSEIAEFVLRKSL